MKSKQPTFSSLYSAEQKEQRISSNRRRRRRRKKKKKLLNALGYRNNKVPDIIIVKIQGVRWSEEYCRDLESFLCY
jgi:hypothetical protein